MRFGVFAFFQALRSLVRLGWLFFLGLRLFFAVVVVLRVIARHCIAFCHASDAGWGVSYWQCVVRVRTELWRARGGVCRLARGLRTRSAGVGRSIW